MYSRSSPSNTAERSTTCSACKVKGHTREKCWTVIGYPKWHPKHKPYQSTNRGHPLSDSSSTQQNIWPQLPQSPKRAATVTSTSNSPTPGLLFTPQQLEQLAQLVPQLQLNPVNSPEAGDNVEFHFPGMISCHNAVAKSCEWSLIREPRTT